jgi:hypothetical protein
MFDFLLKIKNVTMARTQQIVKRIIKFFDFMIPFILDFS